MNKRGEVVLKRGIQLTFIGVIILVLSLSLLSAGFIDGLLRALGIPLGNTSPSITGNAGINVGDCYDSDGDSSTPWTIKGYVEDEGIQTKDYCYNSNILAESFCCDTEIDPECAPCEVGEVDCGGVLVTATLPLITGKVITGKASTGDGIQYAPREYSCSDYNLVCKGSSQGAYCGCDPGDSCFCTNGEEVACGAEAAVGVCQMGKQVCTNNDWGPCYAVDSNNNFIQPLAAPNLGSNDEICNGL
ncbi:MAG: hypothetical protein KKB31_03645, partial [Nanoarchaeota archaeon]|nr:hypothetical protein [Nanoarchaeota archaeon]